MNIVIISAATYPHQSPRAMRTHELAKELAKKNDVTLYVQTGSYNYSEYEKKYGLTVKCIGETFFSKFDPQKGRNLNLLGRIITKTTQRFTNFPDIELALKTYKVLSQMQCYPELLITIAMPHSIHWGVALFKSKQDKLAETTWVADCGDPFMGNPFNKKAFYFKYIETMFCKQADFITVPVAEAIGGYYPQFKEKIKVIPQGFEIPLIKNQNSKKNNQVPTFIFAGNFYKELRDPTVLLDYLVELSNTGWKFKFIIYTKSTNLVEPYVSQLQDKLVLKDFIPRSELLNQLSDADFLINIENLSTVQSPSKLIDYKIANRPVLSFRTSEPSFKFVLLEFLEGNYKAALKLPSLDNFDIKNIAQKFVNLVD